MKWNEMDYDYSVPKLPMTLSFKPKWTERPFPWPIKTALCYLTSYQNPLWAQRKVKTLIIEILRIKIFRSKECKMHMTGRKTLISEAMISLCDFFYYVINNQLIMPKKTETNRIKEHEMEINVRIWDGNGDQDKFLN